MGEQTPLPAAVEPTAGECAKTATMPAAAINALPASSAHHARTAARTAAASPAATVNDRQFNEIQRTFGVRWEW
jgi:hypothetical protein